MRYSFRLALAAAALAGLANAANAQTAQLVADTASAFSEVGVGSEPYSLHVVGNRIVFVATESSSGRELWGTDGTAEGTHLLIDVCPGYCESSPAFLTSTTRTSLWAAALDGYDSAIVATDGTPEGTRLIRSSGKPLRVPDAPENVTAWVLAGTDFFFPAQDAWYRAGYWHTNESTAEAELVIPDSLFTVKAAAALSGKIYGLGYTFSSAGEVLWESDGTTQGTRILRSGFQDFAAGERFRPLLVSTGTMLFFVASESGDSELWVSDGTAEGTAPATDFAADDALYPTDFLLPHDGYLYFAADDVYHGQEIWRTDITSLETSRVTEFGYYFPFIGLGQRTLAFVNGRIVFYATDGVTATGLWASAGTPESTELLLPECQLSCYLAGSLMKSSTGQWLFFALGEESNAPEPWVSDGTPEGTRRLGDLYPGVASSQPVAVLSDEGGVYFTAVDADHGVELWKTMGAPELTVRLTDFAAPDALRDWPQLSITRWKGKLFLPLLDSSAGRELWFLDEQTGLTSPVSNLASDALEGNPSYLASGPDWVLFTACSEAGLESLWAASAEEGDAAVVHDLGASRLCNWGDSPIEPSSAGGLVYFLPNGRHGDLWRSDGTPQGTFPILDSGGVAYVASEIVDFNGQALLAAWGEDTLAFWISDGSTQGTSKLVAAPPEIFDLTNLSAADSEFWFIGERDYSRDVWLSDGTTEGTQAIAPFDLWDDDGLGPQPTPLGGWTYFAAGDWDTGMELWRTDGSASGTSLMADLNPGIESSRPRDLLVLDGHLFFLACRANNTCGLWRGDGGASDTVVVKEFADFAVDPGTVDLRRAGELLYFAHGAEGEARELWVSDGTADGTRVLGEVAADGLPPSAFRLTPVGDLLYFVADDGVHGPELWRTDGTPEGTWMVQDLFPGPAGSDPRDLTVAGDYLYFSANDGVYGRELWALPLTASATCEASGTRLCLNGNRFQAEVLWRDFFGNWGQGQAVPLTSDTGYFWFFRDTNVETILKVLDGQPVNGHHWAFYSALSNVEYTLTITDTESRSARRYYNPSGRFASVGDVHAFGALGAHSGMVSDYIEPEGLTFVPEIRSQIAPADASSTCAPSATRLCLQQGRFAVEATWTDFQSNSGIGQAVSLTPDTGYFWFFRDTNVETVIKVLDGRPVNGKFWLFYGALSNVEYTMTVTDTLTGIQRIYYNPSGQFGSVGDISAF